MKKPRYRVRMLAKLGERPSFNYHWDFVIANINGIYGFFEITSGLKVTRTYQKV